MKREHDPTPVTGYQSIGQRRQHVVHPTMNMNNVWPELQQPAQDIAFSLNGFNAEATCARALIASENVHCMSQGSQFLGQMIHMRRRPACSTQPLRRDHYDVKTPHVHFSLRACHRSNTTQGRSVSTATY